MATVLQIGKVRPVYRGEWDSAATYEVLDWVLYRGLAYQALQDVPVDHEPDVHADYWVQTGMKGDKGEQGVPGPDGPAGVNGRDGLDGAQGPQGIGAQHRWEGSALAFTNPDGTWSAPVDLRGAQGVVGPEGAVGPQGIPGPLGPQGPQGPQGVVGPQGAMPQLNNTVTSASTTEAATANAVKVAHDKGVEALGAANTAQGTANIAQNAASAAQGTANTALAAANGANLPRGIIALWSGAVNAVPSGWALCNGTNGTPDLRDRFVVGAGGKYAAGATGGAETHSHSVSGSAGATTLSAAQMPSHGHSYFFTSGGNSRPPYPGGIDGTSNGYSGGAPTDGAGSSGSHTHSLSASAAAASSLPPYLSLAYIMKL